MKKYISILLAVCLVLSLVACGSSENKEVVDGMSAMAIVDGNSEWLCEAYMNTDYSKLTAADFQSVVNNYLAYLVKEGILYGA